jgi:hypothetical protein
MRQETFPTPTALRLKLTAKIPHGSIDIEELPGDATTVELEALSGNEASAQAVQDAKIELKPSGTGVELIVDAAAKRRFLGLLGGEGLRLRITMPPGADIDLFSGSADMSVRGHFGALKVQTGSGDLEADEFSGAASVKTASGDIAIRRVGADASIATASGDIELGLVEGELIARAASGDVRVAEARGSVTIKTASGDQHVGIRNGSIAFIDAKTWGGEANSELDVAAEPAAGESAELEVRATAASGDITIVRA